MWKPYLFYDNKGVINIPPPKFRCDASKHHPFEPFQGDFDDEPRYWAARRSTLNLLILAFAKLELVCQSMV